MLLQTTMSSCLLRASMPLMVVTFNLVCVTAQPIPYGYEAAITVVTPLPQRQLSEFGAYADFSVNKSTVQAPVILAMEGSTLATGCKESDFPQSNGSIVMIKRGACRFLLKGYLAMLSGASAMIVVDNKNYNKVPPIMSSGTENNPNAMLGFISLAVTAEMGNLLIKTHTYATAHKTDLVISIAATNTDVVIGGDGSGSDPNTDGISDKTRMASRIVFYASGVVISGVVVIMMMRLCRSQRPIPQYVVEQEDILEADTLLNGLDTHVHDSSICKRGRSASSSADNDDSPHDGGDDNDEGADTCCICLDTYSTGQIIQSLPCKHDFHGDCIGPWLRQHRDCPLCKQDVYTMFFSGVAGGAGTTRADNISTAPAPAPLPQPNGNSGPSGASSGGSSNIHGERLSLISTLSAGSVRSLSSSTSSLTSNDSMVHDQQHFKGFGDSGSTSSDDTLIEIPSLAEQKRLQMTQKKHSTRPFREQSTPSQVDTRMIVDDNNYIAIGMETLEDSDVTTQHVSRRLSLPSPDAVTLRTLNSTNL